ncbi:acyltransferase family protein [Flavobacterium algicola]|uniref:acyltransferase family protein n=1 Tax=Flavobacterium algicola TaxID=556529 RepID=UPI001EFCE780|nr:acyltransferase [Flavobacterium algicola]MCG9793897.1 acyltransferase [Flavobacterium algicola]
MMTRENNFHFLRFLLALFVVVTHSYALSGSDENAQWIVRISNGQLNWSSIGLNGFFVISGYFIFQSLDRSTTIGSYFKKRVLRVFPGLLGALIITMIAIPFVYVGDNSIFNQRDYYTYLANNLSLFAFQSIVKGVFDTNYYHSINGSLWTIRYEFFLYIALASLYFIKANQILVRGLLFVCFIFMYIVFNLFIDKVAGAKIINLQGFPLFNLGTFFVMGSLLSSVNFEKYCNPKMFLASLTIIGFSVYFQYYELVKHVLFPVLVLSIGFIKLPFFSTFGKYGDMSYGIYIYSFPVQQILVYLFDLKVYILLVSSILISVVLGYLSWHLIEKRALLYKTRRFEK